MKSLLTTILLFVFCLVINAQQQDKYANFSLKDGRVYWQKVYEMPGKSIDEIKYDLKILFENRETMARVLDSYRNFKLVRYKMRYKEYGYTTSLASVYMQSSGFNGIGNIDVKDGKYRVTLLDISWTIDMKFKLYGVVVAAKHKSIENTIVKNKRPAFKHSQKKNIALMSKNFDNLFDVNEVIYVGDDNW